MNTLYPDATPEELALSDNICIICREDMVNNSKKLPCGHIFHTACLRSWFQRQQTCPTCRLNILRTSITATQPAAAVPAAAQNNNNNNNNNPPAANENIPVNPVNQGNVNIPIGTGNPFANLLPPSNTLQMPFNLAAPPIIGGGPPGSMVFPTFPFMSPYAVPPPPMPPSLDTLTDDELRELEGNERRHVEQRIKLLRNVQLMLNASTALMLQYNSITANLPPPPPSSSQPSTAPIVTPVVPISTIPLVRETSPDISAIPSTSKGVPLTTVTASEIKPETKTIKTNDLIKIEDVGSEEHLDLPSTSSSTSINDTTKVQPTTIHGLMSESSNGSGDTFDTTETSEVRRRRLQKFLNNEINKSD